MFFYILNILSTLPKSCTNAGYIAITFDDGPSEIQTPKILDMCEELGIKVTFHFSIQNIVNDSVTSIINRAVDEGHCVGLRVNPGREYDSMDERDIKNDIESQLNVLNSEIGENIKFARAPIEDDQTNQHIYEVLKENDVIQTNYSHCLYHLSNDPEEAKIKLDKIFKSSNSSYDSFIFLLHDEKEEDFPLLEDIVTIGRSYGYEFVTLNKCLKDYEPGEILVTSSSGSKNNLKSNSGTEDYLSIPLCLLPLICL